VVITLIYLLFIFSGFAAQRGLWSPRPRGFLITHNDAPQSVGLFWASNHPVAEQHTTQTQQTNIHAPGGILTNDRSRRTAVDLRLRPRGHWDRLPLYIYSLILFYMLKFIHLIERRELVSGETCVTVCISVRGIQRGRMM
jgi:hypothetical protein